MSYLWKRRMTALPTPSSYLTYLPQGRRHLKSQNLNKHASGASCHCPTCWHVQPGSQTTFFNIPELLSMVFELCLPEDDLPTDDPRAPPVLFTRVCRPWRQVALATPCLWARLYLIYFPIAPSRILADGHSNVLSDWLTRSGTCPASLRLRCLGSSASDVRTISKFLTVTLPHAHRLREIDVMAPMPCLQPILRLLGQGTPALETCRITITSANAPSEQEDLVVDFDSLIAFRISALTLNMEEASRLKHLNLKTDALTDIICTSLPSSLQTLNLNNFDLLLGPPGLKLSFQCTVLRKLTLHSNIQVSLLRQLAAAFPLLEDAYFNIKHEMNSESASDLTNEPIAFHAMQSLRLRASSMSGAADLRTPSVCLNVLHLPKLVCLSLTISCALQRTWIPLSQYLTRTHPPLKELTCVGVSFTEEEFLAVLRATPHLESLKICVRLTDDALAALTLPETGPSGEDTVREQGQGLCPRLTSLDIPLASPCLSESVITMLLSRCSLPPPVGNINQDTPTTTEQTAISRTLLEECRLILSEPGAVEYIEGHPGVAQCVQRGLRLDLRGF